MILKPDYQHQVILSLIQGSIHKHQKSISTTQSQIKAIIYPYQYQYQNLLHLFKSLLDSIIKPADSISYKTLVLIPKIDSIK